MAEETIENIHPSWFEDELALMTRIKQIISGDENGPFEQKTGYKWQLDGSNDWWAEIRGNNKIVIAYRYGESKKFKTIAPYLAACFCRD